MHHGEPQRLPSILPYNPFRLATVIGFDADLPRGCFEHAENAVNSLPMLLDWSINESFSRNSMQAVQYHILDSITVPSAQDRINANLQS